MYEQKLWQDHVTEFEDRYTESRNDDGTITHTPVEGEIIQQGTPVFLGFACCMGTKGTLTKNFQ